jgi:hypothetical protein
MHAVKEQMLWYFVGTQKNKHGYFVTFVVGNIGGLLALLPVHYISASTDMNTVALQKLRRNSNENLFLIKLLFCIKTCELITWCATWFLYVTLIYFPYELNRRIILRWIFRRWEGVVGNGWSWLRLGTGGGHLWVRWRTFGFQKCGEFIE